MTKKHPESERATYQVPILSTRYLRRFIRFMEGRGIGRTVLLADSGLSDSDVDNPDGFLNMEQAILILGRAQSLLTDERAPFQFGQELDFPAHGLLGYALLRQQNHYKLTQMIVQYLRVGLPLMDMEVTASSSEIFIHLRDVWKFGEVRPFVAKIYMGGIYTLASNVCHRMSFDCDFPAALVPAEWRKIARCAEMRFDQDSNRVIIPIAERPTRDMIPDSRMVLASAESRERMRPDNIREVVAKVREIVSYNPDRRSTLERVARKLGMSARSLRDHLARAETSFREIRNEIREAYATRYLTDTRVSLDIIAEKVGFSDQAGFTRAYRSWTGQTPGQVRRQAQTHHER